MQKQQVYMIIHFLFTIITLLLIITGFGITSFQVITPLTFGMISKAVAFQLHSYLIYPFLLLLGLHLFITMHKKRWWRKKFGK